MEGTWTAFRFDHVLFETPAVLAYDGSSAWVRSAMYGAPDGQVLTDAWKRNVIQDAPSGPRAGPSSCPPR